MKLSFLAPALLLHLGVHVRVGVFAQTTTTTTSFTPSSVPLETRTTWCKSQTDTCGTLCGGKAKDNSCDPDSLTYTCICVSGIIPPLSNYQSTIPYFICQQTFIDCTTANPGNISLCASTCGTEPPSAIPGANVASTTAAGALQTAGANASKTSKTTSAVRGTGASAAATASQTSGKSSSSGGVSTGAAAGIAIGGAAVAIAGTTAVIWLVFRRKYGKGKRKRESEVFGIDGRYKELDTVRGHPGAFGRFEKDGVGGQVHEMGAVGGKERPPRPPRPDAELDSGSLDWVELPSGK